MNTEQLELIKLQNDIDRADVTYYRPGLKPIITDAEYDSWKRRLKELAPDDSRNTRVGPPYSIDELRSLQRHTIGMGSLDNTDGGIAGLAPWYHKLFTKLPETDDRSLFASYKVDGSSIAAYYTKGVLVRAITRGNGVEGEDVTVNAARFRGLPTVLREPITAVVRGEAVLYKDDFLNLVIGKNIDEISNARNTGNGIIGRLNGEESELINFVAFAYHSEHDPLKILDEQDKFNRMMVLGFQVVPHRLCTTIEEVESFYSEVLSQRQQISYDIDGVVVSLNSTSSQNVFITSDPKTRMRPKYARAIKFPEYSAVTKISGVTLTIGHTGAIIPTARLCRVRIGGVFVENVLLTNFQEGQRLGIAVGDDVEVVLAGDIIPKITSKIKEGEHRKLIEPPSHCPTCGSSTTFAFRNDEGANLYCTNAECPGVLVAKVGHWIGGSKKGVGILGIGDEMIKALWDQEIVNDPSDLYLLTPDEIENVLINGKTRIGRSRAEMICRNIQAKRDLPLHIFLGSLGVDLLGRRRVQLLQQAANGQLDRLEDWMDDNKLADIQLEGLGDITRQSIRLGLRQCWPLIRRMLANGVTVQPAVTVGKSVVIDELTDHLDVQSQLVKDDGLPLSGITFVFTGTRECIDQVIMQGGDVQDGIRKNTKYLVQKGDKLTAKAQKAQGQGVKVISLDTLKRVLTGEESLPCVD